MAECPPETSDWEISADVSGKSSRKKKENRKREGGKLKMEREKVTKRGEDFFFLLVTFENDWFWVYQNGNFLP